jgi:hypothetical protein
MLNELYKLFLGSALSYISKYFNKECNFEYICDLSKANVK